MLEISATPYIFTFKLWDWGRVGLDGLPRPIHISHGKNNIQWDRNTEWVNRELVNRTETICREDGVLAERTGLHPREFIETIPWPSVRMRSFPRSSLQDLLPGRSTAPSNKIPDAGKPPPVPNPA